MGKNTSVSLGDHFEEFVETRISQGRYKNASEVIRAGLRMLEEEEVQLTVLKKEIKAGINSGIARKFDPEKHIRSLKAARKRNG